MNGVLLKLMEQRRIIILNAQPTYVKDLAN